MFCVLRLSEQVIAFFTFSCVFSFFIISYHIIIQNATRATADEI